MSLTNKLTYKADKRIRLDAVQLYEDCELSVGRASKIVSITANCLVSGIEVLPREAKVSYKIAYKIIFIDTDGSIDALTEVRDYVYSYKSNLITAKSRVVLDASIIAVEYVGTSTVKIRTTLEISGFSIKDCVINMVDSENSNICFKFCEKEVENIIEIKDGEVLTTLDYDVKGGITRILCYDSIANISSTNCTADVINLQGECITYVTYLVGANICSRSFNTPFSGEILANGVTSDTKLILRALCKATSITLLNGNNSEQIRLDIVITVGGCGINTTLINIPCDAYSMTNELAIKNSAHILNKNNCYGVTREKIGGNIRLTEDREKIRSVLCVSSPSVGAINASNNNGLVAEGIVTAEVIYLSENDTICSVLAEIPYQIMVDRNFQCNDGLTSRGQVLSLNARARHNDEIELSGELCVEVFGISESELDFIEDIEELGAKELYDCAISLYIVRAGETLWDVAKALGTDEKTLISLNPEITLPLVGQEKVLLYREIFED